MLSFTSHGQIFAGVSIATVAIGYCLVHLYHRLGLPPGPRGWPLLGNLFDRPKAKDWLVYSQWTKVYGEGNIISLRILGHTLIVLNSAQDAKELLQTRAANYSSRINMTMVKLIGMGDGVVTSPPGERFRTMRKLMTKFLGSQGTKNCEMTITGAVIAFLSRLQGGEGGSPEDLRVHVKRLVGSTLLQLVYGYLPTGDDDAYMKLAEEAISIVLSAARPGWLVDTFPSLRFLPSWLPGMGFKRTAERWRATVTRARQEPWKWAEHAQSRGAGNVEYSSSFAAQLLSDPDRTQDDALCCTVLLSLYSGGLEPTSSAAATLFLTLAMHPDAQAKAQEEIDSVTREERLPTLADRPRLPYLNALLKEVYRWQPIVPLAIPHISSDADQYERYRIPKGSIVLPNIWHMLHDPEKYPDPMDFKPERFLDQPSPEDMINEDPTRYVFGFGQRKCPGRLLADSFLFLLAAKTLATVHISETVDMEGKPLSPDALDYSSGTVSQPPAFTCTVRRRRSSLDHARQAHT
ncbi:cytochrome P450 [Exidia glandulosa HHB12029]|uniref:Cytochrome P450 n=1 Tax=Exidia glandulosa HHB12029 TaxID=1314781 RepID=A0A166ASY7_EXIGL|nr:cytochrome P450 [Exidia glandulosa HHB12029]